HLAVEADTDQDEVALRPEVRLPDRTALLDFGPLLRIDIARQRAEPRLDQVTDDRQAHAPCANDSDDFAHRFCGMVSISAGWPACSLRIARFRAAATAPGLSIGPSAYQPIDRARVAKSGSGSDISIPMCARSTGVPRSFAMRIWCSQSL